VTRPSRFPSCLALLSVLLTVQAAQADGPQDNLPDKVRRVPPPGIKLSDADRAELSAGRDALGKEIDKLRGELKGKPALAELLPDVQIFYNAVHYALTYDEFFKPAEVSVARKLLKHGFDRARDLRGGVPGWTTETGLVVRGYVSKIDGSVQPYGLVVPAFYRAGTATRHRLDLWWHGRGETLSELNFLNGRLTSPGEFTPPHAFVLHPYGRYCNANHFAGEIDTFEALEHAKKHYSIDDNRMVARGFSMGGAACWAFAVHYADRWAAAAPGAGFAETSDFLRVFQSEDYQPPWYEKKLLHWYDCTDWAGNLIHCPTVAYSGDKDKQKQAADLMVKACAAEGIDLVHVIGPGTGHAYHPAAKAEINRRIDSIVSLGRDPAPRHVRFTTWTLRYPSMHWVRLDGLKEHWERARVDAAVVDAGAVKVTTRNVTALTLEFAPGHCPLEVTTRPKVVIDGQELSAPPPARSDRSWSVSLTKTDKAWALGKLDDATLRKRPGLQGPIDDAFMDRFVMVRPTGQPMTSNVGKWVAAEMKHAVEHWRKQFRGEAPVKDDTAITDADIAGSNLILWGDPSSNAVLAKIAGKLPISWTAQGVGLAKEELFPTQHVPVLIYPNPLNPKKYVVLNSGFTFREYDYLNNARQVPKLPDWAVLDITQPPNSRTPGRVIDAGFFDEQWRLTTAK
jgi:pimeloyl-ACP methyl ester carboxylesterase